MIYCKKAKIRMDGTDKELTAELAVVMDSVHELVAKTKGEAFADRILHYVTAKVLSGEFRETGRPVCDTHITVDMKGLREQLREEQE